MIEALRQHEDFGDAVAAGADDWSVVAARASVGLGRRDAVEISGKEQRRARVGDGSARSFAHRSARAFLHGELCDEELPPVVNQLPERDIKFLTVLKVDRNGHFAAGLGAKTLRDGCTGRKDGR